MQSLQGTVILKVLKATLSRDTELIGKMAPYCAMTLNNVTSRTTTKKNYGKTPEWYEVFSFQGKLNDEIKLKVWDKESIGKDDLVAEGIINIKKEFINMKYCFWVPLKFKNANAGQIQVDIEFIPNHDSIEILMHWLQDEYKEKQALLNNYEHKPNEPNAEILNTKAATNKKIQELHDQLNQLKIEFQTKKTEIEQQVKINSKCGEEMKKKLDLVQQELKIFQTELVSGFLKISCLDGVFTRDVGGMFDKMDPFVVFSLSERKAQTTVKQDAGSKAIWNENLEIERNIEDELRIEVYDYQDNLKHRLIGYNFVSIRDWIMSKEVVKCRKLKLIYKGEEAGEINFDAVFVPK